MSDPFLGEIRIFAGQYAPRAWGFCDGQLLPVNDNQALYSLFNAFYGGDGRTTFGLPDFRGRLPVHMGQAPGLSRYEIGQRGGRETVSLTIDSIPEHNHPMQASNDASTSMLPGDRVLGKLANIALYDPGTDTSRLYQLAPQTVGFVGGEEKHLNMMPYLCLNYIVALEGVYPSRN